MTDEEEIFFDSVKEHRGWYFVEYSPPNKTKPFASLSLTTLNHEPADKIATAMEAELSAWLKRYPIEIMIHAFDETGSVYNLEKVRPDSTLMGYLETNNSKVILHWGLLSEEETPKVDVSTSRLKEIYKDVGYRTRYDIDKSMKKEYKNIRLFNNIVIIWVIGIPTVITIFMYFAPDWIGRIALIGSLGKAAYEVLKMKGKIKKSDRKIKKEAEELRVRHHHYHCEQNPEGFLRLKLENFERESRERIQKEAASLKK